MKTRSASPKRRSKVHLASGHNAAPRRGSCVFKREALSDRSKRPPVGRPYRGKSPRLGYGSGPPPYSPPLAATAQLPRPAGLGDSRHNGTRLQAVSTRLPEYVPDLVAFPIAAVQDCAAAQRRRRLPLIPPRRRDQPSPQGGVSPPSYDVMHSVTPFRTAQACPAARPPTHLIPPIQASSSHPCRVTPFNPVLHGLLLSPPRSRRSTI